MVAGCVAADFVEQRPEWREWHKILQMRGRYAVEPPEQSELFLRIAQSAIDLTPALPTTRVRYIVGDNVAEGDCTISFDSDFRAQATFQADLGTYLGVKRRFEPGKFVRDDAIARIEPFDGTWLASGVVASSQGERHRQGQPSEGEIVARIDELKFQYKEAEETPAHVRWIVRGSAPSGSWPWRAGLVQVNPIPGALPVGTEVRSVLVFGTPALSEDEGDALWDTLCFLEGRNVQVLATEAYNDEGRLLYRSHRLGKPSSDAEFAPFRHCGLDVAPSKISAIQEAFTAMHEQRFNISRILDHMLLPVEGYMLHEALHLSVAAHTIMSELQRFWKRRRARGNVRSRRTRSGAERGILMPSRNFKKCQALIKDALNAELQVLDIDRPVKANMLRGIENANQMSMGDRLFQVLEDDLGMVLDAHDRHALGYRNQLAHEGGFAAEFFTLTYDEQNVRLADIGRLRNIVTEAVLRLCGYEGVVDDFTLPGATRFISGTPASPFLP